MGEKRIYKVGEVITILPYTEEATIEKVIEPDPIYKDCYTEYKYIVKCKDGTILEIHWGNIY